MAKAKTADPKDLTFKERVAAFEALVKVAIEQTQIGMQLSLSYQKNLLAPIMEYVDLIELKAKQDEQKKAVK